MGRRLPVHKAGENIFKADGHVEHLQVVCSCDDATDVVFAQRQLASVHHVQQTAELLGGNHGRVNGDGVGAVQERPDRDEEQFNSVALKIYPTF